ncbi:hypothetical protein HYP99_gp080 [Sinorhizobium phage ort11]|uniref:Uncharacterized protein n=1 Tax=Sinorhizobium phage ort11 TaxID=2599764 RepID=A0A5C2H1E1_9CAUD|nr:hypothetical protein HYP99_gp080 [Sinorhizobium phage ort11]QEP29878.1 hypothetical protein Smphiort11_080 [Sinorhizobium phage ort11]
MTQLPLVLAIPRFKENEERVDKLVNGTALETWQTSGGVTLPSFAKFLADKDDEIDSAAESAAAAALSASAAALSAATSETNAANAINRANHIGTQSIFTIVEFNAFNADDSGLVDVSAAFQAIVNTFPYVRVVTGEYLIDDNVTVPSTCVVIFDNGAKLKIGTDVIITWNGGIIADAYQQIFSGDLVQSSYVSNSLTPYILGLQGNPRIPWSSPFWFGAKGDNVTDDYNAFVCSFFFGPGSYVPGLDIESGQRYLCSTSIPVRRSMFIKGDGYRSWMRLVAFTPSGVGQFIGIAGLLPTVSGGQPAVFVDNILIDGIHVDTNNGTNDNGIGGSMCRNVEVRNCFFSNVGRKAVTFQYHVHNHYVHHNWVLSASMETAGNQNVFTTEGENSSFTYSNGVVGFDHDGADNTGHVFDSNHIEVSGVGGVTLSNCRRSVVRNLTMNTLGATGRPIVTGRVVKDVIFENIFCKTSTLGFIHAGSATSISVKFINCWIENCSGDEMFYSEGPGAQFINSGGTQTDDRLAWSIRGTDCKILNCRLEMTAITSATQATSLFSTASRFEMKDCYINSANALRGFGGSTAADIKIIGNHFTGGVTDGISISGANFLCINNIIGGNAINRIVTAATAINGVCTGNILTGGASAQINMNNTSLFSSVKCNNPGDTNTGDNMFLGINALWQDSTGDLRIMTSGALRASDTDGVIVGTQT